MTFKLTDTVPWGRSYDEYRTMFRLSPNDLEKRILGCGDGPAAFNATLSRMGGKIVSVDPIYQFSVDAIRSRIDETANTVASELRANVNEFVWTQFASVEDVIQTRMQSMNEFLADYPSGRDSGRYIDGFLPKLRFESGAFDLAVCSHLLFLYSEQLDLDFHLKSIIELCRISREVRIFPLLELSSKESRHVSPIVNELASMGFKADVRTVDYEFQKGGNEMMVIGRA